MAWEKDSGYNGRIRSLAGVYGRQGAGLEVEFFGYTTVASPGATFREANTKRVWMLIQNVGADRCTFALGDTGNMFLYPGQTYEINALNPWTGPIHAMSETNDVNLACTEAQVQAT